MNAISSPASTPATLKDLEQVQGKAELIGGRIVLLMPTGHRPNLIAGRIYRSLAEYVDRTGRGVAYTDNMGFAVRPLPSGRQSFSPDAAYYLGPLPSDPMRFVEGAPALAVEVRSENDYGPAAEAQMADKRADYFAANSAAVWDVDPRADCVRLYRPDAPDQPVIFQRGQEAHAEPAVPGWRVAVDWIFA
jgi:Uma2 family endonuclease